MNPADFYRDDRLGEYEVQIEVRATLYETVTAESPEAAREKVMASIDNNEIDVYGQDIDEAMILSCRKTPPMFCITRPGTTVTGTSRLQPGDEPRLPKDYERGAYKPDGAA